jgi:hypothetical protein
MDNEYYLTPEDFEIATKNGISEKLAKARFYQKSWSKRRSITEPKRGDNLFNQYKDVAVISRRTFGKRIKKGWDPLVAATTPSRKKRLTEKQLQTAESNGINRHTAKARVYSRGWEAERAITEPVKTKFRRKDL